MAVADINGDGLDDFFIWWSERPGREIISANKEQENLSVPMKPCLTTDAPCEDVNAVFFDAEGDGDKDLYVVSGGNRYPEQTPLY